MTDIDALRKEPGWRTERVKCRICGYEAVAVFPEDVLDEDRLECAECGHMTCGVIE